MVIDCKDIYTNNSYNKYFNKYNFNLSDFQKYAIEAIVSGNHSLITAHTGSGKTLPAEFAIEYFFEKNKKVIYTSPIKALSNQKFNEFSEKFPHIEFGILTGDIKHNPGADVLIMTTEILNNTLFQLKLKNKNSDYNPMLNFDMDINNDLGCVIFDEVHYINDSDRGRVWEETIINTPDNIQLIMLSATIDRPLLFAKWIENIKNNKKVYLSYTYERVVPLKHYFYYTFGNNVFNLVKDKEIERSFKNCHNKLISINDEKTIDTKNYKDLSSVVKYLEKYHIQSKPTFNFVLNNIALYLKNNNMLPAISFVFSRKLLERMANTLELNLFNDDDSKIYNTIEDKVKKILMKLPNYQEYLNLPEYNNLIKLLKKGIGIHHSGITPIFREIVEILFAKGQIKMLFATETMSIGINMPTKTVLFTDLEKYDGKNKRYLMPHEYTQMAGRAGRRNIDDIGYVIHLNNLFNFPSEQDYSKLMNNKAQLLKSKFKISFNLLLTLIYEKKYNYVEYIEQTLMNNNIKSQLDEIKNIIDRLKVELNDNKNDDYYIYYDRFKTYKEIKINFSYVKSILKNKTKNKIKNEIMNLENEKWYENINNYNKIDKITNDIKYNENRYNEIKNYINDTIRIMLMFLETYNFIIILDDTPTLTEKGKIALELNEVNNLVLSEILIKTNFFQEYNVNDIICILSIFNNLNINHDNKNYNVTNNNIKKINEEICELMTLYEDKEIENNLDSGLSYDYNLELEEFVNKWINANDEKHCKIIMDQFCYEKNIFNGEIIKAILKIVNISNELIKICETYNKNNLLSKIQHINEKLMKFIITNKSLYV